MDEEDDTRSKYGEDDGLDISTIGNSHHHTDHDEHITLDGQMLDQVEYQIQQIQHEMMQHQQEHTLTIENQLPDNTNQLENNIINQTHQEPPQQPQSKEQEKPAEESGKRKRQGNIVRYIAGVPYYWDVITLKIFEKYSIIS